MAEKSLNFLSNLQPHYNGWTDLLPGESADDAKARVLKLYQQEVHTRYESWGRVIVSDFKVTVSDGKAHWECNIKKA